MVPWVLCVDDDSMVLLLHEIMMQENGFARTIDRALNGEEALEKIHQYQEENPGAPMLLILDLNMPVMDGWTFLETIQTAERSRYDSLYIYICTSSLNPRDRERAFSHDLVKGYLEKPLTLEHLSQMKQQDPVRQFFESE